MGMLSQLSSFYEAFDVLKRELFGSIFREMLRFKGLTYRTAKLNEAAALVYLITKLKENKNGKSDHLDQTSHHVLGAGIEPARL